MHSNALVAAQFACWAALFATGPVCASNPYLLTAEVLFVALGIWAIVAMRLGNFNIRPDVPRNGELIVRGPYAFIRHPMYTSLLLTMFILVLDRPTIVRAALWLALCGVILMKLRYEEKLLIQHYPAYSSRMRRTKRLIPFVW